MNLLCRHLPVKIDGLSVLRAVFKKSSDSLCSASARGCRNGALGRPEQRGELTQVSESRELDLQPDLHLPAHTLVLRVKKRRRLTRSTERGRCPRGGGRGSLYYCRRHHHCHTLITSPGLRAASSCIWGWSPWHFFYSSFVSGSVLDFMTFCSSGFYGLAP